MQPFGVVIAFSLLPQQVAEGREVPLVPVLVSLAGLVALAAVSLSALRLPRVRLPRREPRSARAKPAPAAPPAAPAPAPSAPVYKKAPATIELPPIKPDFPDVWGLGEALDVVVRLQERGPPGKKVVPGLTLSLAGQTIPLVFYNGVTSVRKSFPQKGEIELVVDYRAAGDGQPRRTTRRLRIVDYREEIAEVFHNFKQEAAKAITPLRDDATAWEIYETLTEASPKLPRQGVRDIVTCFEEAKFSNHPVTRATYERMINALLQLEQVEL